MLMFTNSAFFFALNLFWFPCISPSHQVLTYPMEMYVCRHVLDVSVFQTLLGMGPMTSFRHYGITVALWLLSIILATATDDLGPILEVFGAFGASVSGRRV